ncbi:MAG TPA: hypothetical protein VFL80_13180, partial [Thermoanaerobaculia bacterium]|nr:hypothetical protein [Thermoanaerobaculia bacterium]
RRDCHLKVGTKHCREVHFDPCCCPTHVKNLLIPALLLLAAAASADISVKRAPGQPRTLNIDVRDEPLSIAVAALEMHLPRGVEWATGFDPAISMQARGMKPEDALRRMTALAGLTLMSGHDRYVIRATWEPTVTLDVKDAEARDILKSMQRQCGVKNLVIDPDVGGKGTFMFREVPCRSACRIVLRSLGLSSVEYSSSVTLIEGRTR